MWVYNTYAQWGEQFPWLKLRTIRYHMKALEGKGYLITGQFNQRKADQTKWYRINYTKLDEDVTKIVSHVAINGHMGGNGLPHGVARIGRALPETTTEITTETIKEEPYTDSLLPQLQSLPYWKHEEEDASWLTEFTGEFPEFVVQNLIECRDFWDGRRARGKGDWKNRLRNWMKKGRQFAAIRRSAQAEVENKRSAIPSGQKKIGALPTSAELAEQKRRIDEGLPPVERSRYG